MPLYRPFIFACALAVSAASCSEATKPTPCDAYRTALVRYADHCEPLALPAGGDPNSIECTSDGLSECTTLLERHTDPCVGLLWHFDTSSTEVQRDEQADLRAELYACAREPIAEVEPLPFENDCAAWRDAVGRYRICDPAVVPTVTNGTRCVDDAELPEGRTVRGCAETLWERSDGPCYVPLGDERAQCLEEVIADFGS